MTRSCKRLLCAFGVITSVLTVSDPAQGQEPTKLPAGKPPVAVQPPQGQIREQILPYTVRLALPLSRPETFGDGGSMWLGQCKAKSCTVTAPSAARANEVCRRIPARLGAVAGVTRGAEALTAGELKECNRARQLAARPPRPVADPSAAKPVDAGPQPEPLIRGNQPSQAKVPEAAPGEIITPTDLKPAEVITPTDLKEAEVREQDVRLPSGPPVPPSDPPEGAAGVEEMASRRGAREAAERLREDMARRGSAPEITGFGVYPCLPAADDTLAIEGHRFGVTPGSRRVVLGPAGRRFEVRWTLAVLSWSDERIQVVLPPGLPPPPQTWAVAIADGAGEPVSNLREFRECPSAFRISGRIAVNSCGASLDNIAVDLVRETPGDGPSTEGLRVGPDPYNDLGFRYEGMLRPGAYQVSPRLTGGICAGGSWSPGGYSVRVSEFDGSPGAPRSDYDFTYDNVPLTTTRIPGLILTSQIQTLFDGTEMRLNNSGPESPRGSWFKPDDSWIRLSEALGGTELPLDIPAGRGGVFQYYVNDVNLSSIRVGQQANAVVIRLVFESAGVELNGYCWGTRSMIDLDCPVGPDDTAPDVQIDNLVVRVDLPPARFVPDRGPVGISYGVPRVVATADVQARGVCEVVDVCGLLIDYEELILTGIETGLETLLDQRWIKEIVADGLRAATASPPLGPIGDVNSVRFEGSDLVIRHRPR